MFVLEKNVVLTYTVVWKNHNGEILETDENVPFGTMPEYNGETPVKEPDAEFTYTFSGWTPDIEEVTQNAEYTAIYIDILNSQQPIVYTITFETNGGTEMKEVKVAQNTKLTKPAEPAKDDYIFDGWYTEETFENLYDFDAKVTNNFTLYAKWRKAVVSDVLNTKEHFAYVKGYHDNRVRPESNITRAETTEILFRLLKKETRNKNLAYANSFDDAIPDAWYNTSLSTMTRLGIIKGKTSVIFAPDDFITRAEFAAICARFDDNDFEITNTFSDISGHWAEQEIYEAAAHGWIKGYEDNTFRPDEFISRAEAITMINRMLGRTPESTDDLHTDMKKWVDNSEETAWYYIAIQEATNDHGYTLKNDGSEQWSGVK